MIRKGKEKQHHSTLSIFKHTLPNELMLHILGFLDFQTRSSRFGVTSKNSTTLANDPRYWKKLYHDWSRYLVIPIQHKGISDPKCYKTAFKQLYLSLSFEEKILIQAAIDGNQTKLNRYRQKRTLYSKYRNRLLIIATCQGDIQLLSAIKCSLKDIQQLALVSYSTHADNRQDVLNYFWTLRRQNLLLNYESNSSKNTLAHWAAILNQAKELTQLLKKNTQLAHQVNVYGITPYMLTRYYKHNQCTQVLEDKKEKTKKLKNKFFLIGKSIKNEDIESSLVLLATAIGPNFQRQYLNIALHIAAEWGHIDLILLLLQCRTDINSINEITKNALTIATFRNRTKTVLLLLKHDLSPDLQNHNNDTALITAADRGNIDITQILLQHNANPSIENNQNKTALMIASSGKHYKIICLLYIAMTLRGHKIVYLQTRSIRSSIRKNEPQYFKTIVNNILNNENYWPWVTEEMRNRLRQDPLIQKLSIDEKATENKLPITKVTELKTKRCIVC